MKVRLAYCISVSFHLFRCTGTGIHRSHTFFSNGGRPKHPLGSVSPLLPSFSWPFSTKLSSIYVHDTTHLSCAKLQKMMRITSWLKLSRNAAQHPRNRFPLAEIAVNAPRQLTCVDTSLPPNHSSAPPCLHSPIFTACS